MTRSDWIKLISPESTEGREKRVLPGRNMPVAGLLLTPTIAMPGKREKNASTVNCIRLLLPGLVEFTLPKMSTSDGRISLRSPGKRVEWEESSQRKKPRYFHEMNAAVILKHALKILLLRPSTRGMSTTAKLFKMSAHCWVAIRRKTDRDRL